MSGAWKLEAGLVLRSKVSAAALALLAVLAILAVWSGMQGVAGQRAALARIAEAQRVELAAMPHARPGAKPAEAGSAAYATPHLTTSPPSPLAFAAFGQRDVQPYALRVRLLGLQAQLYESEAINPELAAAGRFDFAFMLVYLAPLVVIALMHDLLTGEREAGRLRVLASLPAAPGAIWRRRIALRYGLVLAAVLPPLAVGAALSGALPGAAGFTALLALATALYLAFWFGLCAWVGAAARSSATSAAILLAAYVMLTLVLPALANAAIARAVPVGRGAEMALAQRQEVHNGWDLPKPATFEKFFRTHPEWRDTPPVTGRFHWKWYFAMHQTGDDAVAPLVRGYHAQMLARDDWTRAAGALLAPVSMQLLLQRLADTDLQGHLAYLDRVSAHHTQLRRYFYPFIFNEQPFGAEQAAAMPAFAAPAPRGSVAWGPLAALALLAGAAAVAGLRRLARVAV